MSIVRKAFQGGIWLAAFTFASQALSWGATILIARLLSPGDYGLMSMATILTGYIQVFYQMGIGAAIIQREDVSEQELSSLFWFLSFWGVLLGALCLVLAYPTVVIFSEPGVFYITQSVSVLFAIGAAFVVPNSLLQRELRFKAIGFVMSASVVISCAAMLVLAYMGAGVWTLIGGNIIRDFVQLVLTLWISAWRPRWHFRYSEAAPYLRFGLPVVGGSSLQYIYSRAPVFFGGRAFSASLLGQYSLASELAVIPNSKIISLIQSVSYPVFSKRQNDHQEFRSFYLRLVQLIAFIVLPLYGGGIFVADYIIPMFLGEKWEPSILPFKLLCVGYAISAMASPSHLANTAQGRPHWSFYFQLFCALTMPFGFYLFSAIGIFEFLALPWATLFPAAQVIYTLATLKRLRISPWELARVLCVPLLATLSMVALLFVVREWFFAGLTAEDFHRNIFVLLAICLGAVWYLGSAVMFQKDLLRSLLQLARP